MPTRTAVSLTFTYVKNIKLALIASLMLPFIIISCKKSSTTKPHTFTYSMSLVDTITTNLSITKNSSGNWVVSGTAVNHPDSNVSLNSVSIPGGYNYVIADSNSSWISTKDVSGYVGESFSQTYQPSQLVAGISPYLSDPYFLTTGAYTCNGDTSFTITFR